MSEPRPGTPRNPPPRVPPAKPGGWNPAISWGPRQPVISTWTVTASRRLTAYLGLGGAGLLAGLLLGRPEPVVLAAPFLLTVAIGLALARPPELRVHVALDRERALEGEEVELEVRVEALRPVARLELDVRLPRGLQERRSLREPGTSLGSGQVRSYRRQLRCLRWGGRLVGQVRLRARDPLGLFTYEEDARRPLPLRVYPRAEAVRRLLRPVETQTFAGNEVSRLKGDGIEFADIRPFLPGDRVRRVNWRASARRGHLHVNEMRPERNADVVLFLDTFTDLSGGEHGGSLEVAVRGAAALADAYLRRRDRVGLVGFGGTLRWLRPAMGMRQVYQLVDALIDTEVVLSYAWKGLEVIPPRTLPPKSLVVAITPLLDERTIGALFDLGGRGYDLAVVEVSPLPFVAPGRREVEQLAYQLWQMEREAQRGRFLRLGVPVVTWRAGEPLEAAVAAATRFRHDARMVRR